MSEKQKSVSSKTRLLDETTPFAIKESFNHLRTNLMYTAKKGDGCPVFAINSADAGVGKSTVISNLAISFAQLGKKVLLVDADMRQPTQFKIFGYDKKHSGLSELLAGLVDNYKDVICTPYPSLDLLTSGCIPPNPSELINGRIFKDLIHEWKQSYDVVLIDFPPVGIVSDSLSVADIADGYVVVIMMNKSDARRANTAISAIEHVGGKVLGIVINSTSPKGAVYGKNQKKYGYGYYYSADQD